jgi:hypothetical protein
MRVSAVVLLALLLTGTGVAAWILIPWAMRYPLPAVLGVIGAVLAWVRFQARTRGRPYPIDEGLFNEAIVVSAIVPAAAYLLFAAAKVGVPDASVSLPWRIVGGAVFGAIAGLGAAYLAALFAATVVVIRTFVRRAV